jgi:hypothetical protein
MALSRSIGRLMPGRSPSEALAGLLLSEARRKLIKYEAEARRFQRKYRLSFDDFRDGILCGKPDEVQEQDYFDWEAVRFPRRG